ncbi:MAG: hypothetical protein SF187_03430 [Deltaproteobacteria bacterium]|nr:hypothetical protein [Deltaproteobacteria bacterium]
MNLPDSFAEPDANALRRGPRAVGVAADSASRLIHDLNNVLTVMLTTSSFLGAEVNPQSPLFGDVNDIVNQARRAATLVQQLSQQLRAEGRRAL